MKIEGALEMARAGRLYPGVILHGADDAARREAALELAKTLLCAAAPDERPCGVCSHCRRIVWGEVGQAVVDAKAGKKKTRKSGGDGGGASFHPDFGILERDLRTVTSVDATKQLLKTAQVSPYEARGQVFVVADAESLSGEAANALLKTLEEPATSAPRHFLLLAGSQLDLLPTLRSRSLAVYLGPAVRIDGEAVDELAATLGRSFAAWAASSAPVHLLLAAGALRDAADWSDPRATRPWSVAAAAVLRARDADGVPASLSRPLLALAEDLLDAQRLRLRGIPAERILEGLVARRLG